MDNARKQIKKGLKFLVLGLVVGVLLGAWMCSTTHASREPVVTVERDTVTGVDTLPDRLPTARDSGLVRWMVVRLPVDVPRQSHGTVNAADTGNHVIAAGDMVNDTVEVALPVTQKHYQAESYQAWVSGYMPSLDSIEVYQKTRTITETITVTQHERKKRWGIGITGGYGYDFNSKRAAPYIGVGISYNFITF